MRTYRVFWPSLAAILLLAIGAFAAEAPRLVLVNPFPSNDARIAAWAESVNASGGSGAPRLEFHASESALASDQLALLAQLATGKADIALVITNYFPNEFPDDDVTQLPGLFASAAEGSVALWRLHARKVLRGYGDYELLALFTSGNNLLHTNFPVRRIDALRHKRIRVGSTVLLPLPDALGAEPVFLPISQVRAAFLADEIDGAITVPAALFSSSRIAEVAQYHLAVPLGRFHLALLMRKDRFSGLPATTQATLKTLSGETLSRRWGEQVDIEDKRDLWQLANSPGHDLRSFSLKDHRRWVEVSRDVVAGWRAQDKYHAVVLDALGEEIARTDRFR